MEVASPVHVDKEVHKSKKDEGHAARGHDEADGPEVFVDGDEAVVQGEARESTSQTACDESPDQPPLHSGLPVLVDQEDLACRHPQPAEEHAGQAAQQPLWQIAVDYWILHGTRMISKYRTMVQQASTTPTIE